MTLATRCTACGTTFKVVQDQLKISGGWVRCGRCSEVFNAIDGLFEFRTPAESATASTLPPAADMRGATEDPAAGAPAPPEPSLAELPAGEQAASPGAEATWGRGDAAQSVASTGAAAGTPPSTAEQPLQAQENSARAPGTTPATAGPELEPPEPATEMPPQRAAESTRIASEPAPAFVRKADRAARWRRPSVRLALALTGLALAALLGLQASVAYRSAAAARWPAAAPALQRLCAWLGCTVEPLRRIGALSVDASGLQQVPGTPVYRLSIVLRNRSDLELMLPSFDLTLTDARGEVVARRVLAGADLGGHGRTIGAGVEVSLEASLNAGDRGISGYTIETFYP